jgi:hypothetical protein
MTDVLRKVGMKNVLLKIRTKDKGAFDAPLHATAVGVWGLIPSGRRRQNYKRLLHRGGR